MDIDQLLVESVESASSDGNYTQFVDYEWRAKVFHHCMHFGHEEDKCRIKKKQQQLKTFKRPLEEETVTESVGVIKELHTKTALNVQRKS